MNIDENVDIFNRINVIVGGHELDARPIDFIYDDNGNAVAAIKYETTCPGCGVAIQFSADDIRQEGEKTYVSCNECGLGKDFIQEPEKDIISVQSQMRLQEQTSEHKKEEVVCPFIDPIETQIYLVEK